MIYCKIALLLLNAIGFFALLYSKIRIENPEQREKEVNIHIVTSCVVWALYYGCGIFDLWPKN